MKRVVVGMLGAMLFALGLVWSAGHHIAIEIQRRPAESEYSPSYDIGTGYDLVAVYFGSGNCSFSEDDVFVDSMRAWLRELKTFADSLEVSFSAIGVAVDWAPDEGVRHLARVGQFDEISAGSKWGNRVAETYLWKRGRLPSTPSLLILLERVDVNPDGDGSFRRREIDELMYLSGVDAIENLSRADLLRRASDLLSGPDSPKSEG